MSTTSAIRSARRAQRRRIRTRALQSEVKSTISQARRLLAKGDETAPEAVSQAVRTLDKASGKGIVHPNTAARHKSRLARRLNKGSGVK